MFRNLQPALAAVLCASLAFSAAEKRLTEDQKIEHALNRLTFGAGPGQAEQVRRMGLRAFIEQQLHPETIAENPVLTAKLAPLETLVLGPGDMARKYPSRLRIKRMADGSLPYPEDPELRAVVEHAVERAKAKLAGQQAEDNTAGVNKAEAEAAEPVVRGPAPNLAAIESLPPLEQLQALKNLPRGKRQALYKTASPALRRRIELLQETPQQVVGTDLAQGKIFRAVYSNRQLEEVLTDFWYNHFNVYLDKGADRYLVTSYERDVIRPRVLGRFEDLLLATAQSPAMLFYLDNARSVAPGAVLRPMGKKPAAGLNENYARELMELHTLGVDGGFTQQDVTEVARCFTGWSIGDLRAGGAFRFNQRVHDRGAKTVLGVAIPAGGGIEDGLKVLDILAHRPATAHFISLELATRFVSDRPAPALVDRMAATFTRTDGDLRATLTTMFDSPEFFAPATYLAKVKTPFEMVASSLRAAGADVDYGFALIRQLNSLGQPLYRKAEPTGYSNKGADWLNSASLLARMNFAVSLSVNQVPGTRVEPNPSLAQLIGGPEFQKH